MNKRFLQLVLIAGILMGGEGHAQDAEDFSDQETVIARKNLNEKLQSNNNVANAGTVSNLPSISLTSLFSDTQAEAKFSVNAGESLFNIGLSQSFSEKPGSATFLDLEGITTGTTFSVAWQRTIGRTLIPTKLPITDLRKFIEVKQKVRERKKIDPANDVTFLDMDEADKKELIEAGAINLDAFETPWIFTARFSASRVGFDYITDSLAARPSAATRVGKNFNLAFSKFKNLYTYYSFSYGLVVNYASGSDVLDYSFPVGTNGHAFTSEVTYGAPAKSIGSRIKAELRQMITRDRVPVLGLNPSVTWIVKSEKLNLDIPVYFLTKREDGNFNGLQAGIKIGYTSRFNDSFFKDMVDLKSQKVYFGLFVTKPFLVKN
ncbi:hypothetical protein DYBT9623_00905 [Dyadobacter sp. CECT 9623]|uniref:Uncharacterized protein n=1 Tax=Dyadobacter linearis TaxID=2823330 RepID=A0ABM8UL29_9BACT|nr:hypothetical protein [Dyadobacter sp. CECT 9623]CAG5068176.1 hypothetical protein DYBT9623_00905 [Dyadobacter sp. CECT 9623]